MGYGSLNLSVYMLLVAALWSFCCSVPSNETDRMALLELKSMISADPLGALSSWNDSIHFCNWYGVSCSKRHYGRVTALRLQSQGLSGSISPHVGNLSFLTELALFNNNFVGEIPPEISRLGRLQRLGLFNSSLSGEIPSNISRCSALTIFNVNNNNLVGGLPWNFGLLNRLQWFFVRSNHLTGSIPPSFGNLSSLLLLEADSNQLSGTIPEALGQLKKLLSIGLTQNNLSGKIPPSIFNLSSLTDVHIGWNQLHGDLPWNLGISFPHIESLNVEKNHFTGSIPSSLSNVSDLIQLQLQENNFTGSIPNMASSNKLRIFSVYKNSLGSGKTNDLSFISSLTNSTRLQVLQIGSNNFGGSFPQQIGNLSANLWVLSCYGNQISGTIPSEVQYLVNLGVLSLLFNNLSGTIPFSIGGIRSLETLLLDVNNFSGPIPLSIGNLTKLAKLTLSSNNLQGQIPTSINNCQRLLYLDLSGNNLNGAIPSQLFSLTSLSIGLYLSGNHFIGALPGEVGNLKNLDELDISHNMLSGNIPTSIGGCVSLELLYLQGNLLRGPIPSSLSSLRGIRELDLSVNNLSGQIPRFLELMNISQTLNLSYNNLEGQVPERGAFKNGSIVSVIGNSKLCGGVAELKLRPCNKVANSKKSLSRKWKIVISTMCAMLFCTFMVSCSCTLCRRKKGKQDTVSANDQRFPQLTYQTIYNATNGFSSTNLIGVGSFGSVYKGVLDENEATIAVKVFNLHRRGASKSFVAECEALKNIRHKNLVKIVTVSSSVDYQGNDFKALVYEFLDNGSLEEWMHPIERTEEPPRILNFIQRLNVAIDIASAVDYLHNQCGTPIVHCDLKPSNVLLDADMIGHVGDFGLARFLSEVANPSSTAQPSSSIGIRGTIGYAPPEYGMGNEVSIQGDVYGYGILLLEMFTGRRPTDETFGEGLNLHNVVKSALSSQHIGLVVDPILLSEQPPSRARHRVHHSSNTTEETKMDSLEGLLTCILEIGVGCSSDIPEERASMSEVLSRLVAIRKSYLVIHRR